MGGGTGGRPVQRDGPGERTRRQHMARDYRVVHGGTGPGASADHAVKGVRCVAPARAVAWGGGRIWRFRMGDLRIRRFHQICTNKERSLGRSDAEDDGAATANGNICQSVRLGHRQPRVPAHFASQCTCTAREGVDPDRRAIGNSLAHRELDPARTLGAHIAMSRTSKRTTLSGLGIHKSC